MILQSSIFTDFYKKSVDLNKQILHAWVEHSLFAWRWWLGILLIVISLTLWIRYRNRESADRFQYAGLFVALASSNLDYIGTFFGLWKYDYEIFPVISHYIPFSFFVLPITVMFLLQTRPRTNALLKALTYSIFSVIALPIVDWIGIYDPVKWHYFYSFIIQFFIYLIAHYISVTDKFKKLYST